MLPSTDLAKALEGPAAALEAAGSLQAGLALVVPVLQARGGAPNLELAKSIATGIAWLALMHVTWRRTLTVEPLPAYMLL